MRIFKTYKIVSFLQDKTIPRKQRMRYNKEKEKGRKE